jgi:hypothetical protein
VASWLSGVRRHEAGVAPCRPFGQDHESLFPVGHFGVRAGLFGDAFLAQLCHPVIERAGSGDGEQGIDGMFVVIELPQRGGFGQRELPVLQRRQRRGEVGNTGSGGHGVAVDR